MLYHNSSKRIILYYQVSSSNELTTIFEYEIKIISYIYRGSSF